MFVLQSCRSTEFVNALVCGFWCNGRSIDLGVQRHWVLCNLPGFFGGFYLLNVKGYNDDSNYWNRYENFLAGQALFGQDLGVKGPRVGYQDAHNSGKSLYYRNFKLLFSRLVFRIHGIPEEQWFLRSLRFSSIQGERFMEAVWLCSVWKQER